MFACATAKVVVVHDALSNACLVLANCAADLDHHAARFMSSDNRHGAASVFWCSAVLVQVTAAHA
jgi:hypothetical protein